MSTDRFVIVVGIDFSGQSDHALDRALAEACRHEGSEVHVVHVEQDHETGSAPAAREMGADATVDRVKERICQRMHRMPSGLDERIRLVVAHYRHGLPAEGIAHLAADLHADLVVVGSFGRGAMPSLSGSVTGRIGHLVACRVWVVPEEGSVAGELPRMESPCRQHPLREHRRSWASNGVSAAEMIVHDRTERERDVRA